MLKALVEKIDNYVTEKREKELRYQRMLERRELRIAREKFFNDLMKERAKLLRENNEREIIRLIQAEIDKKNQK